MSMKVLTVLQFISIFAIYTGLFIAVPALLLHRRVKDEIFPVRFFFYIVLGHFYLINLVLFLQLFHISGRFTLILGSALPVVISLIRTKRVSPKKIGHIIGNSTSHVIRETLGIKLLLLEMGQWIGGKVKLLFGRMRRQMIMHFVDWALFVAFTAVVLVMYGTNMINTYGYCASDIPVHNYWINAMGDNEVFVNGIYPFGFHCVIYYIHTVSGIETYVLLRLFYVVQALYIHYVLLAFLKACCKTSYCAWGGVFVYVLAAFFSDNTFMRYYSSLPQEFGMIFILPGIYFMFAFLKERKLEADRCVQEKNTAGLKTFKCRSTRYLMGFVAGFGLTLIVHFYDTMAAGLLCIGIAGGYLFRIFKKEYFFRILATGILSIFLAALPMGIAFLQGTPLQGSLGWGLSVIDGSNLEDEEDGELDDTVSENEEITTQGSADQSISDGLDAAGKTMSGYSVGETESTESLEVKTAVPMTLTEKIRFRVKDIAKNGLNYLWTEVHNIVLHRAGVPWRMFIFGCEGFCLIGGLLFVLTGKQDYGAGLMSVGFGLLFLMVLLGAWHFGLPHIMDPSRCSIYVAYMIPVAIGLGTDGVVTLVFGFLKRDVWMHAVSLLTSAALVAVLVYGNEIRTPAVLTALESNAAITCLANIKRENENYKYTICSANDELRMMEDYARHDETITFLRRMEGDAVNGNLTIPTDRVYFFIEKIPLDYTVSYEGSGQRISSEGAEKPLPTAGDISVYEGENRWIVMSRMYYWAQAFMELYGKEMQVYYETDDFVCYVVEQNTYSLYDFSIDYGYN